MQQRLFISAGLQLRIVLAAVGALWQRMASSAAIAPLVLSRCLCAQTPAANRPPARSAVSRAISWADEATCGGASFTDQRPNDASKINAWQKAAGLTRAHSPQHHHIAAFVGEDAGRQLVHQHAVSLRMHSICGMARTLTQHQSIDAGCRPMPSSCMHQAGPRRMYLGSGWAASSSH